MTPRATDAQVNQGQQIFRFDTFGDEQLWTDTLRMHEVIQSSVSPVTALSVGLKVDATALPANFLATRDLNSPAVLEMGGQGSFSDLGLVSASRRNQISLLRSYQRCLIIN